MTTDLYTVLGVPRGATPTEVQAAYRRRATEVHPDVGGSTEEMVELNRARDVLTDLARRAAYNESLRQPTPRSRTVGRTVVVELPTVMPWGMHRDVLLEDVPSDYLRWVLREATYATPDLVRDIRAEIASRRAAPGSIEYVARGRVVHLSLNGDLPLCGSLFGWKSRDSVSSTWPGGTACRRGCFE